MEYENAENKPTTSPGNRSDFVNATDKAMYLFEDKEYRGVIEVICTFLTVVGVCGNITTFFTTICKKRLHSVTYTVVACLTLPDAISLVLGYCFIYRFQDEVFLNSYILRLVIRGVGMAAEHGSAAHMVFLAAIRCLLIAKPLWCHANLRPKNIIVVSAFLWFYSVCFASGLVTIVYLYQHGYFDRQTMLYIFFGLSIYLFFLPPVLIFIFHCLKVRAVKKSMAVQRSSLSSQMSRVFLVILIAYIATCTADLAYQIISLRKNLFKASFELDKIMFYLQYGMYVLWMIHYSLNPFIYFFISPPVKTLLQKLCAGSILPRGSNTIKHRSSYVVSGENISASSKNSVTFSTDSNTVLKDYFLRNTP